MFLNFLSKHNEYNSIFSLKARVRAIPEQKIFVINKLHGIQTCRIARYSLFSDDTILKVNDILTTALLKAPGGFPLSRIQLYVDQLTFNADEFLQMLSLHVAIDSTHMKIYSKYFKSFIVGDGITEPSDIHSFLESFLCTTQNIGKLYSLKFYFVMRQKLIPLYR